MTTKTIGCHKANGQLYRAWGDVQPDGSTHWMLATHNPVSVFAEATITITRTRRRDLTGHKAYRIVTRAHCLLQYRITRQKTFPIEWTYHLGEIGAVRALINVMAADNWPVVLANELWLRCYEAGVDQAALFNAQHSYSPAGDPLHNCRQMFALLETKEGSQ
jgi:hypothetical protein